MRLSSPTLFAALALIIAFAVAPAGAAELQKIDIEIEDHHFRPAVVKLPADTRVVLVVHNLDPSPEEFESNDASLEKIVPGNGEITLRVGPLPKGEYRFFGEFFPDYAQGKFVVE